MLYHQGNSEVSVALGTSNGASFIIEQLSSIAKQEVKPGEIVVCDDGSTDNTVELVSEFAAKSSLSIKLIENAQPLGICKNYTRAIENCQSSYIALSDQDDLWLPNKLKISLEAIVEAENKYGKDLPLLVHTDLQVIDQNGEVIAPSFMRYQRLEHVDNNLLARLIAHNFVTASTILFNRALLDVALPVPEEAIMHDWWLALVAAATGKLIFVPEVTVLYRQHDRNLVGSRGYYSLGNFMRLGNLEALEQKIARTIQQSVALQKRIESNKKIYLPDYVHDYLDAAGKSGIKAWLKARHYGIGQAGGMRDFLFKLLLFRGKYRRFIV